MASVKKKADDEFPFRFKDYLSSKSVRTMTAAQRGYYVDLLCYLACEGDKGIKDDDEELMELLPKCSATDLAVIKRRCHIVGDHIFNKKLSELMKEEEAPVRVKKEVANLFNPPNGLTPDQQVKWKKEKVKQDMKEFVTQLEDKTIYSKEMLNDFYSYWTEPTPDKKKLKMELQDTWEYERRIATWHKRDKTNPANPASVVSKTEKALNTHASAKEIIENRHKNGSTAATR